MDLFDRLGDVAMSVGGGGGGDGDGLDAEADVEMRPAAAAAAATIGREERMQERILPFVLGAFTGLEKGDERQHHPAFKGTMPKSGAVHRAFERPPSAVVAAQRAAAEAAAMDTSELDEKAPDQTDWGGDALLDTNRRGIFGLTFGESPASRGVSGVDPLAASTTTVSRDSHLLPGVDRNRDYTLVQRSQRIAQSRRHEQEEFGTPGAAFSTKRSMFSSNPRKAYRPPLSDAAVAAASLEAAFKAPVELKDIFGRKRKAAPATNAAVAAAPHSHGHDHEHDHDHEHEHGGEADVAGEDRPRKEPVWKKRRLVEVYGPIEDVTDAHVEEALAVAAAAAPARPRVSPLGGRSVPAAAAPNASAAAAPVAPAAASAASAPSAAEAKAATLAATQAARKKAILELAQKRSELIPALPSNRVLPIVHVGSWANAMADVREMHFDNALQEQQSNLIFSRYQASFTRFHASTVSQGELCERNINKTLNSFGMVRAKHQRQFHEVGIMANMRAIHSGDYERNRIKIMRKKRILELRTEVLCQTPRRYGKTTGVAMLCAALMLNVSGIRIAIFSTGKRASQSLMHLIVTLIHKIPFGEKRIVAKNQEQLLVASNASAVSAVQTKESIKKRALDPTTSVLMSLPGSETGTSASLACCLCVCVRVSVRVCQGRRLSVLSERATGPSSRVSLDPRRPARERTRIVAHPHAALVRSLCV